MLRIVTKLPPAKSLSPNSRVHWAVKSKASKAAKKAAANGVKIALLLADELDYADVPWHEIELQAIYYHHVNRRRDPDNLIALLKYPIDGLVMAGLLVDDDRITLKPVIKKIDKENPRLELIINPIKQADISLEQSNESQ